MALNTKAKVGLGALGLTVIGLGFFFHGKGTNDVGTSSPDQVAAGDTKQGEANVGGEASAPGAPVTRDGAKSGVVGGGVGGEKRDAASVVGTEGSPTPGSPATNGGSLAGITGGQAALSKEKQEKAEPLPSCRRYNFASKNSPHRHEKNALSMEKLLKESSGDAATLCLRVDGTPVKFALDRKKSELQFASVRRADSRVSVSFCRTGVKCEESCVVPRDEFLEALTGGETGEDEDGGAGWAASREEQELETQIAGFQKALKEGKIKDTNSKWSVQGDPEACGTKVAAGRGN